VGSVSVVFGVDPVEGVSPPDSPDEGVDPADGVSSPESPPEGSKAVSSVLNVSSTVVGVMISVSNVSPSDEEADPVEGVSSPESPPEVEAAESIASVLANEIRRQLRSSSILGGGFVSRLHRMNRLRWRLTYRQGE
jgi:hypothetical protein